ncbi:MAG: hypothetical protein H6747_13370 [Deltaproteobacteria bacterium]|nr:hypothetical protein [Deltaproteobacteria bacterium]
MSTRKTQTTENNDTTTNATASAAAQATEQVGAAVKEQVQSAFAAAQEAMTASRDLFGAAFAAPEGIRNPGLELWQKMATGSVEGFETWSREILEAQKQGAEHAQHLFDEAARLGNAGMRWQLDLLEKSTRQAVEFGRQSARSWQSANA